MSEYNWPFSKKQTDLFDHHPQTDPDKENNASRSDGDILLCPHCGNPCLHQQKPHTTSPDVVRIRFTCEGCPNVSTLQIKQHKGITYVRWLR
jgi:hypothetical protein